MALARGDLYTVLIANLFQGIVAILWISGLKRFAKPLPHATYAELLRLALIFPVWLALLRQLHVPFLSPRTPLVRIESWSTALRDAGVLPNVLFFLLLGGVVAIFCVQELVPFVLMLNRKVLDGPNPDPRLNAVLDRVNRLFRDKSLLDPNQGGLKAGYCIPFKTPLAALHGLSSPVLVVSEGLLDRLNDAELECVIAHEAAHLYYGGNLRMVLTWSARALQAFNPCSLILFRELTEAREHACDALAARATGAPRVLAAALLKFNEREAPSAAATEGPLRLARQELRERAELDSSRLRFQALMEDEVLIAPSKLLHGALIVILGGLLWAIA